MCCLFVIHQAQISIAKRLIQERYTVTRARVEPETILVAKKTALETTRPRIRHEYALCISFLTQTCAGGKALLLVQKMYVYFHLFKLAKLQQKEIESPAYAAVLLTKLSGMQLGPFLRGGGG